MKDALPDPPIGREVVRWRFPGYPCEVEMRLAENDDGEYLEVRLLPDEPYVSSGQLGGDTWHRVRDEATRLGANPWQWVRDVWLPGSYGGRR